MVYWRSFEKPLIYKSLNNAGLKGVGGGGLEALSQGREVKTLATISHYKSAQMIYFYNHYSPCPIAYK